MIISEHEQGSPEWMLDRTGIPSASNFSKIFTTTLKSSTQAAVYMNALLAEFITGEKEQIFQTDAMARGIEMEVEARQAYEFVNEVSVMECGFCFKDADKMVGASPDGLVEGGQGILEIKVPKPSTHVGYLLAGKLPSTYFPQVHGQLWVTGRDWCDFISYSPGLPNFEIRVERDPKIMADITVVMEIFILKMRT